MQAGPGLCRADARGWDRRGGEEALARVLLEAARRAVEGPVGVGVADTVLAADVAARLAVRGPAPEAAVRIVPRGASRAFLAPLSPELLELPAGMLETLRALGVDRVGWLAERGPAELEARFGPDGLRVARAARGRPGEEDALPPPPGPGDPPEARMELEPPVSSLEPLRFVLRHLLARLCPELAEEGLHAARLRLALELEDGSERTAGIAPARPTRREGLLLELCSAALERAALERTPPERAVGRGGGEGTAGTAAKKGAEARGGDGRLPAPVAALRVTVIERRPAEVRQEDLFVLRTRDPADAAEVLSRLHARLGEGSVVLPAVRSGHRPEARSGWRPAAPEAEGVAPEPPGEMSEPLPAVLHLLPRPRRVEVRPDDAGRPALVRDGEGRHRVTVAEGPERISGGWWGRPFAREYWRVCTGEGELLWLFREPRPAGEEDRWHLHGWWD